MTNLILRFLGGEYDNLCRVEVSGRVLRSNYLDLSARIPVAPVLKSNAYGHGLALAARVFAKLSPPFLCVDSLFEAYELLKADIRTKILVMGFVGEKNLKYKRLPFSFAAYDLESLGMLRRCQPQAGIHLFVDTGMHREGMSLKDLGKAGKVEANIEGLMSHEGIPGAQTGKFRQAEQVLAREGIFPRFRHCGWAGNVARVGLELYLHKPALKFVAKIVQVKDLAEGNKVGYDYTFTAKKPMTVAIVPAGYNEGVDRRLSNRGAFTINGKNCSVVGRVNMNMTVVDVSTAMAKRGDEAVIFSDDPEAVNSVEKVAKLCETIPYDILVHINPTIKRVLI